MASDAKTSSHIEAVPSAPGAQAAVLYHSGKAGGRYKGSKYLACGPASITGSSICRPDGWGVLGVAVASVCCHPSDRPIPPS